MKYISLFLGFFFLLSCKQEPRPDRFYNPAQNNSHSIAAAFLTMLTEVQHAQTVRTFEDMRRVTWDRIPKEREGLKIRELDKNQKKQLHALIKSCLSREGYLLVTAIMFNEDIQQKFEPELGKNEFWVEIFGQPNTSDYWGWQLEGHHLSLNFTFKGERMISNTPFLIGGNPQVIDSDVERNGLNIIYEEEALASQLVSSLSEEQQNKGYSKEDQPNNVYGEIYKDSLYTPFEGLGVKRLTPQQFMVFKSLVISYARYFNLDAVTPLAQKLGTSFYFIGTPTFDGRHYYSVKNEGLLIECENYGNHTHHLVRTKNDFGLEYLSLQSED